MNTSPQPLSSPGRRFAVFAIGLTLLRIVALILSDADLGPDEGQYWFWSQAPAFGYFSKPPMIAWVIFTDWLKLAGGKVLLGGVSGLLAAVVWWAIAVHAENAFLQAAIAGTCFGAAFAWSEERTNRVST